MKIITYILILLIFMAGCQDSSSSDSSDSGPDHTLNYTLYSDSGNLPVGRRVVYLYAKCTDSSCSRATTPFHAYEAIATVYGEVSISFTHSYTGWYWASVYIDVNDSNTLTKGDLVWGSNEQDIYGQYVNFSDEDTSNVTNYTWEDYAESYCGGYIEFDGTNQTSWSLKTESSNIEDIHNNLTAF